MDPTRVTANQRRLFPYAQLWAAIKACPAPVPRHAAFRPSLRTGDTVGERVVRSCGPHTPASITPRPAGGATNKERYVRVTVRGRCAVRPYPIPRLHTG